MFYCYFWCIFHCISIASDMKITLGGLFLKRNLVLNYLYLPKVMRQVQLVSDKFDGIALCSGAEWMCLLLCWKLWCAMSAVRACASCMGSPGGSGSCFTCVLVMFYRAPTGNQLTTKTGDFLLLRLKWKRKGRTHNASEQENLTQLHLWVRCWLFSLNGKFLFEQTAGRRTEHVKARLEGYMTAYMMKAGPTEALCLWKVLPLFIRFLKALRSGSSCIDYWNIYQLWQIYKTALLRGPKTAISLCQHQGIASLLDLEETPHSAYIF